MRVAVVGITGLVGTVLCKVLEERNFPIDEFFPVASERSVGKTITLKGKNYQVMSMTDAIKLDPISPFFPLAGALLWNGHLSLQR